MISNRHGGKEFSRNFAVYVIELYIMGGVISIRKVYTLILL